MKSIDDQDPFKPLSAKVGRPQFASGGRELSGARARMAGSCGMATRLRNLQYRKAQDKAVPKGGR